MENEEVMTPEEGAAEAVQKPRRGRRGPRTEEQKQAAAKTREEHRQMAENLRPEVYIQYQDIERSVESLVEEAKADFRKEKKRTQILNLRLYVKPEERTAYYVINEKSEGRIDY